jgi:hypothetical protein
MASTTDLDETERDEFLEAGGTGVLSFAADGDEAPHAVPVSYGYDAAETTFYFRLAVGPDSEKAALVDRRATLVVYDEVDGAWHSVVASGRLESVANDAAGPEALAALDRIDLPIHDVFGRPPREVSFAFRRLVPESLTSLRESPTAV